MCHFQCPIGARGIRRSPAKSENSPRTLELLCAPQQSSSIPCHLNGDDQHGCQGMATQHVHWPGAAKAAFLSGHSLHTSEQGQHCMPLESPSMAPACKTAALKAPACNVLSDTWPLFCPRKGYSWEKLAAAGPISRMLFSSIQASHCLAHLQH